MASLPPPPSFSSAEDDVAAASSDDDADTLRRLMHRFGADHWGCRTAGDDGGGSDSCSDAESGASDDVAYLQRLQQLFVVPAAASAAPDTPPIVKPVRALPPPDTDDEEDFETLRAIQRRFARYESEATPLGLSPEMNCAVSTEISEQNHLNMLFRNISTNEEDPDQNHIGFYQGEEDTGYLSVYSKFVDNFSYVPKVVLDDTSIQEHPSKAMSEEHPQQNITELYQSDGVCSLSIRQFMSSKFPKSVQNFVNALKKNRSCQRFIREKLMEIEAKIEVNKKLKERIKCLMDFNTVCRRKVGHILGQKSDPRVKLISLKTRNLTNNIKENNKKGSSLHLAPAENPQVSNYKIVMNRYPVSLKKRQWSNMENENLAKGVKQQYQEMLFLNSMNFGSNFEGSVDSVVMSTFSSSDHQLSPEILRAFLPLINWDRLASMYLPQRSGPECESRWLNHEDPLINQNPWSSQEDKKLLFTVQERGLYNWIDISIALGTHRTPFQCLIRYQRSLNPHILNKEWTVEEDAKLKASVETFGDNWQIIASHLDGRTSNQCSVRWRSSLLPERKRVGRWSVDEDKRLKVSVILFGAKNWKKIAQFIPGRTQSQCRERWLNCLDPSLNLERWTEEEDSKLLAAIVEHGHRWSKVAACVPPRTDNQCRRRWKILLPHEVPMLKAAQQLKKTVLISNFVGRERERPSIGPSDFTPLLSFPASGDENCAGISKKRSRRQSNPGKKRKESMSQKATNNSSKSTEEKSTENTIVTSLIDAFMGLSLVSGENTDVTEIKCFKGISKKIPRKTQYRYCGGKTGVDGEENSVNICLTNTNADSSSSYLPLALIPHSVAENECTKGKRKRTASSSKPMKPRSQRRRPIDEMLASGELTEDALMELPLVHVLKLISRKSRARHKFFEETSAPK